MAGRTAVALPFWAVLAPFRRGWVVRHQVWMCPPGRRMVDCLNENFSLNAVEMINHCNLSKYKFAPQTTAERLLRDYSLIPSHI